MKKNLIFDLGDVLLPIDFNAPVRAFEKLGLKDFEFMYGKMNQSDLFNRLETGKISEDNFRNEMRRMVGFNWSDQEIDKAWSTILLDFRPSVFEMLNSLKSNHRLFLLSNTNSIHFRDYDKQVRDKFNPAGLSSYFEKAYYSHEIGMRKPGKEIFEYVLNDAGIKADETLFIDDNEDNIRTASALGISVHHLKSTERVESLFY